MASVVREGRGDTRTWDLDQKSGTWDEKRISEPARVESCSANFSMDQMGPVSIKVPQRSASPSISCVNRMSVRHLLRSAWNSDSDTNLSDNNNMSDSATEGREEGMRPISVVVNVKPGPEEDSARPHSTRLLAQTTLR